MLAKDKLYISEERRKKLSDFLTGQRRNKKYTLMKLSEKSGISINELFQIENYGRKKINPFHLQNIAFALEIDYKLLYKLVGYLNECDFKDDTKNEESFRITSKESFMTSMIQNYYGNIPLKEAEKIFEILELPKGKRKKIFEYCNLISK